MNNGKYKDPEYIAKLAKARDERYGEVKDHKKICECCGKEYIFNGRLKTKQYERSKFCSRNCSNSVGGKAKAKKHHPDETAFYKTVAWRHHEKKCVVCGESLIVAVHHMNEDHYDNSPENLVPMCPTHHQYMHSRYKHLVEDKVKEYIKNKWGVGLLG